MYSSFNKCSSKSSKTSYSTCWFISLFRSLRRRILRQQDWSLRGRRFQRSQTKEFRRLGWGISVYFTHWAHRYVARKIIPLVRFTGTRVQLHARLMAFPVIIRLSCSPISVAHCRHHMIVGVRSPDELRLCMTCVYALSSRPDSISSIVV